MTLRLAKPPAPSEMGAYRPRVRILCQSQAWFDGQTALSWAEDIFTPWVSDTSRTQRACPRIARAPCPLRATLVHETADTHGLLCSPRVRPPLAPAATRRARTGFCSKTVCMPGEGATTRAASSMRAARRSPQIRAWRAPTIAAENAVPQCKLTIILLGYIFFFFSQEAARPQPLLCRPSTGSRAKPRRGSQLMPGTSVPWRRPWRAASSRRTCRQRGALT